MIPAFFTGVAQVFLVALQTRQIANRVALWQITLVGCLISAVWVFNVRAAAGTWQERAAYVFGATCGTTLAMLVPFRRKKQ
jgi:hypothetical protein